jgi:ABC-type transport system involved in cytochrome c biogenesis permease subunit
VALAQKNLTLKSPVKMAWSDLWNWPFIITWLMTIFFFFFSQHDKAQTFWLILRPLAIGFLMFYAIRLIPLEKLIKKIEHSRFKKFAESLRSAIETIQR